MNTHEKTLEVYDNQIAALEERLAQVRAEREAYLARYAEIKNEKDSIDTAYRNLLSMYEDLYEASYDGVKSVANDNALLIPGLPFNVHANWKYLFDGIEYIAISDGEVTSDTFNTMLESLEIPET